MKAALIQETLTKALAGLVRIVPARGQLPVLANVLIEAGKEGVTLTVTNLEMGMRMEVGGKVTQEGAITVPAKNLAEFVAAAGGESVGLETEGEKLKVTGGRSVGTFAGIGASEFPVMPTLKAGEKEDKKVKIKKALMTGLAKEVAYAAAGDENRPVLTGVRFYPWGEKFVAVATDGFRLARKELSAWGGEMAQLGKDGVVLPARTILELARIAGEGKKEEIIIEMAKENNQVIFAYDQTQLVSRILEGNFPDVEKIIPKEYKTKTTIDREELVRGVRTAAIFARESSNIVKFKISDNRLVIWAAGSQIGEGEVELEAEKEGNDEEIAFNFRYMLDYLGSVGAERVVLKTSGSQAPGVWEAEKDDSLVALVMPVRV